MLINDLRKKTSDEQLSKKAKLLIRNWKSLVNDKSKKKSSTIEKKSSISSSKSKSASVEPDNFSNNSDATSLNNKTITFVNKNNTPNTSYKADIVGGDEVSFSLIKENYHKKFLYCLRREIRKSLIFIKKHDETGEYFC